jgi:hypothetical protein
MSIAVMTHIKSAVPAPIKRFIKRHRTLSAFGHFKHSVRSRMLEVAAHHLDALNDDGIPGWLSPRERQTLYALARWLPGPILEIGSWLGLSTTAIAKGIRDSGEHKRFDTIDLPLTQDNFRPVAGGIGWFPHRDRAVQVSVGSEEAFCAEILPVISAPGGSNAMLKQNLARLELTEFVRIHVGDFREYPGYCCGLVFCDTLHNLREVTLNGPHLRKFLGPNSIIACHDLGWNPSLVAALRDTLPLGHGAVIDSLYIAETAIGD